MEVSGDVGGRNVVYVELEYLDTASLRIVICYLISIQQTADTCLEAEVGELLHGQPDVPAGRVEDVGDSEVAKVSHVLHRPAAGQQVPRQHLTLSTLQHLKPLTFRTFRYCDS